MRCARNGKALDGPNKAGVLFATFAQAQAFAKAEADLSPRVGCGVYNSAWQVVAEFVNDEFERQ